LNAEASEQYLTFCTSPQRPARKSNRNTSAHLSLQIQQASDILQDGTQDNQQDCDAISFGLGFEGSLIALGSVKTDIAATPPCQ